jgi:glycosyltransferase involved in cell wall biosynthesis
MDLHQPHAVECGGRSGDRRSGFGIAVLHLARYAWPNDMRRNPLDLANLEALADRLGHQRAIVLSRDGRASRWHRGEVVVDLLRPRGRGAFRSACFLVAALRKAWRIVRRERPAVISASDLWGAVVGCVLRWRFGVALVVQLQNEFFDPPPVAFGSAAKRRAMRRVARAVCARADLIRCLSGGIRRNAIDAGVRPEFLVVVGTRVDTRLFSPLRWEDHGRDLRTRVGVGPDDLVVACVGSLTRRKGVEVLVRATTRLSGRSQTGVFLIVGHGPLWSRLHEQADESPAKLIFTGRVEHDRLPAYLAAAEVFAFPSISEGMPRAVLEAMAMGCAVVASDIDGVRDVIVSGENGVLVPPGDVDALARAIEALADDRELRERLGHAAAETAASNHGFDRNMDDFAALFREAVALRAASAVA